MAARWGILLAGALFALSARAAEPAVETLQNGARVIVEPHPGTRTFALRILLVGSSCEDPPEAQGASGLLARMLLRASETIGSDERAIRLEAAGISIDSSAGTMALILDADGPAEALPLAAATLIDALSRPRFELSEVERETSLARNALAAAKDDPSTALRRVSAPLLYGDHCLGRVPPEDPQAWLRGVDATRLRAIHEHRLVGARTIVALAGDVEPLAARDLLRSLAGALPSGSPAPPALPSLRPLTEDRHARAKRRTSQPEILIAMPTSGISDEDAPAMSLLAQILGGFQERLSAEIREKRGWAYWLTTIDQRYPGAGSFGVLTAVPRAHLGETESVVRAELTRIATTSPSEEEVERARRFLATQRARDRQSSSDSAARLARAVLFAIPPRSLDEELARDAAVTPETIRALARRLLDSSRLAVVTLY